MKCKVFRTCIFFLLCVCGLNPCEGQINVFQTVWGEQVADIALDNMQANKGNAVRQTSDGGYLVLGGTTSSTRLYLSKINTDGSWQWSQKYDMTGGGSSFGYGMTVATDGGFVLIGNKNESTSLSSEDMVLMKMDALGTTRQWSFGYGNTSTTPNTNVENGNNVRTTPDGGFILVGKTTGYGCTGCGGGSLKADYYIVKTDNTGALQWNLAWGGSSQDYAYDVCVSYNGGTQDGYVITGYSTSFPSSSSSPNSDENVAVLKISTSGAYLWSKIFDISKAYADFDFAYGVVQSTNGSYIIAGDTWDVNGTNTQHMFLMSIDINGTLQWTKKYNGAQFGLNASWGGDKLIKTSDGGYAMAGVTTNSPTNAVLIKTTSNGTVSWSKSYGSTNWTGGVQQTSDGGYVMVGTTRGGTCASCRQFSILIKTNSGGITTTGCSAADAGMAGVAITPSTTVVPTYTLTSPAGSSYAITPGTQAKTYTVVSSCSAVLPVQLISFSAQCYEGRVELYWSTASEINNSHFIIERSLDGQNFEPLVKVDGHGNSSAIQPYQFEDIYLPEIINTQVLYYRLKQTDFNGNFEYSDPVSIPWPCQQTDLNILPNPTTGIFSIAGILEGTEVAVFNILGEKVFSLVSENHFVVVNISDRPKGIYMVQARNGSKVNRTRIILI